MCPPCHLLLYFLDTGFLTHPGVPRSSRLAGQGIPGILLAPPASAELGPAFSEGSRDPNSGLCAWSAGTFPTEPSPWHFFY